MQGQYNSSVQYLKGQRGHCHLFVDLAPRYSSTILSLDTVIVLPCIGIIHLIHIKNLLGLHQFGAQCGCRGGACWRAVVTKQSADYRCPVFPLSLTLPCAILVPFHAKHVTVKAAGACEAVTDFTIP